MTKRISPLRQRMIHDMSPNSQKVHTYAVTNFSAFHRLTIIQTFEGPLSRPRPRWEVRL